jgi:hypothetical protein
LKPGCRTAAPLEWRTVAQLHYVLHCPCARRAGDMMDRPFGRAWEHRAHWPLGRFSTGKPQLIEFIAIVCGSAEPDALLRIQWCGLCLAAAVINWKTGKPDSLHHWQLPRCVASPRDKRAAERLVRASGHEAVNEAIWLPEPLWKGEAVSLDGSTITRECHAQRERRGVCHPSNRSGRQSRCRSSFPAWTWSASHTARGNHCQTVTLAVAPRGWPTN